MLIYTTLCAWLSRCDCLDPCQLVTSVFPCMQHAFVCLMFLWALACLSMNILTHVVYTGMKHCRCAIAHQMQNSAEFSSWKWGIFLSYSHSKILVRIVFYVLWCTWGEMLPNFHHGNLKTSITLGKHWSRPHPFRNQNSKPNTFKAPKANANNCFFNCQCP